MRNPKIDSIVKKKKKKKKKEKEGGVKVGNYE